MKKTPSQTFVQDGVFLSYSVFSDFSDKDITLYRAEFFGGSVTMRLAFKFGFVGGLGVQLRGGVGGEAPITPSGRPAVSGAALSAPTRGGSRKKIGYNEEHTCQWILKKSIGSQQFSCTYRCASEGVPPSDTAPHRGRAGGFAPAPRGERRELTAKLQFKISDKRLCSLTHPASYPRT